MRKGVEKQLKIVLKLYFNWATRRVSCLLNDVGAVVVVVLVLLHTMKSLERRKAHNFVQLSRP